MCYLDMSIEHGRFAEHDVRLTAVVGLRHIFDALEPHQINGARTIRKMGNESFVASLSYRLKRENLSA